MASFFPKLQVPAALLAAAIILGSVPASVGRTANVQTTTKKVAPLNTADFKDYVTRFNPFNGTDSTFTYSPEEAAAVLAAASQTSFGGFQSREARLNIFSCLSGWWNYGGYGCMYDTTARVRRM